MVKSSVKVNLPKNVAPNELPLFQPYLNYDISPVSARLYKNVFVTSTGLSANESGLMEECHHDYPMKNQHLWNDAAAYIAAAEEDKTKLIKTDPTEIYLLIHHPWFNYYHWLCEAIFRLWSVRNKSENLILLLPERYRDVDFIQGSLKPFSFKSILYIPGGSSVYVKKLCLPKIKPLVDSYDQDAMRAVKLFYRKFLQENPTSRKNFHSRLFISREKAARKKIANENELLPILEKYGFKVIVNEDYSFLEQVEIYMNASFLIGMHGSGLTNMLFMNDQSKIFELHKKITNPDDWHSYAFWYMADAMGFSYYHQLCDPTDENASYFDADYLVDLILFEKNLQLMLA